MKGAISRLRATVANGAGLRHRLIGVATCVIPGRGGAEADRHVLIRSLKEGTHATKSIRTRQVNNYPTGPNKRWRGAMMARACQISRCVSSQILLCRYNIAPSYNEVRRHMDSLMRHDPCQQRNRCCTSLVHLGGQAGLLLFVFLLISGEGILSVCHGITLALYSDTG